MRAFFRRCAIAVAGMTTATLIACTQMPTENQRVPDIRPQISFKTGNDGTRAASVMVDGLAMGSVGDYLDGIASLRILPGTHLLTVVLGNQIILEEKFYSGDGANRTFLIK